MARSLAVLVGILTLAGAQANDTTDRFKHEGLQSKYMSFGFDDSKTSLGDSKKFLAYQFKRLNHAGGPNPVSHHSGLAGHDMDSPRILDKEERNAVQKPLNNDGSTTMGLFAIGISVLSFATMLGARLWRGMQPANALPGSGGHVSDMSISIAPASADNFLELKEQESTIGGQSGAREENFKSFGWLQLSSPNSRQLTLCYATPPGGEEAAGNESVADYEEWKKQWRVADYEDDRAAEMKVEEIMEKVEVVATEEGLQDAATAKGSYGDNVLDSQRAVLKSKLYAACATSDRGFAASPADREAVEEILEELAPLSPTEEPTRGLAEGLFDAPLCACWRLVYTSAPDVATLDANPLVSVGGIYQDARELPVIVNVIDQFPRPLANLSPSLGASLATCTRLRVQTRARPRSATRVGLSFEKIGAEQISLLGQDVPDWLPKPSITLPQLGLDLQRRIFGVDDDVDPRDAESNPAYFDVLYLDDDLLVIRQGSGGAGGGLFAAVKVDDLA